MKTILCIDDQVEGLKVRQAFLESAGYYALVATSGPEGLKIAAAESIDLVLLDYKMEGMNGHEVARRLRKMQPSPPIILLTGYPLELPAELVRMVDRVIPKGQPARELLEAMESLLGLSIGKIHRAQVTADLLIDVSFKQAVRTRSAIVRSREQTARVRAKLDGQAKQRKERARREKHRGHPKA